MGIFDAMKKPEDELSDAELNEKADRFDRVGSYHERRGEERNQREEEARWGRRK